MSVYLSLTGQLISCPSWEANSSSASTIFQIMWHLQVVYLFTAACHLSLCWARQIQSMPSHHSWRSIWVLSPHLFLCHQMLCPCCLWFDYPKNIHWAIPVKKLLIMQFSSVPSYFLQLGPKYSPLSLSMCSPFMWETRFYTCIEHL